MTKLIDLTGQRFGRLVVVERNGRCKTGATWLCACDCGGTRIASSCDLKDAQRNGRPVGCGCMRGLNTLSHGQARKHGESRAYKLWLGIKARCRNPSSTVYGRYGGRGITVCDRWFDAFEAFYADVGDPPPGLTLDRIDNDKGYEPGNVRWATMKEQSRNRSSNRWLTYQGETKTVAEWAEIKRIGYETLRMRLRTGWTVDRSLSQPVRQY